MMLDSKEKKSWLHAWLQYGGDATLKSYAQIEITAFFMPEETKTVKAELRKVRFVDAETWKGESK